MSDYKQTRDAAGKVTSQYDKMLRSLDDDDLVKRLRGWVRDIREGSTALWAMDQDLKAAANRIEELSNCVAVLEAKLRKSALQELSALGQASEAYQAQLAAEAKLELIQEEWAGAVYGDLENGVASLNAAAATDFHKRYPLVSSFGETLNRIIDGEQDDD